MEPSEDEVTIGHPDKDVGEILQAHKDGAEMGESRMLGVQQVEQSPHWLGGIDFRHSKSSHRGPLGL